MIGGVAERVGLAMGGFLSLMSHLHNPCTFLCIISNMRLESLLPQIPKLWEKLLMLLLGSLVYILVDGIF